MNTALFILTQWLVLASLLFAPRPHDLSTPPAAPEQVRQERGEDPVDLADASEPLELEEREGEDAPEDSTPPTSALVPDRADQLASSSTTGSQHPPRGPPRSSTRHVARLHPARGPPLA
jgi:hypothetical protein